MADCHDQGATLAYAHRDHCGLGLTRTPVGHYCYGPVHDGDFWPGPELECSSRVAFEQ